MKRSNSPSHSTSSDVSKSSVTIVSSTHMTTSFGSRSTLSVNSTKLVAPRKTLLSLPTPSQKKRILHTPSTHRVSEKAHVQPLIREPRITGRKRVNYSTSHVTRPSGVKHVKGEHATVWSIIANEHVPAVVGKEKICSRRRVYYHPHACVGHSHVHSILSHEPHAVHVMDTTCGRCIHHGHSHHGHIHHHQSSLSHHFQHNHPCTTIRPHTAPRGCKRQDSMASVLTWN